MIENGKRENQGQAVPQLEDGPISLLSPDTSCTIPADRHIRGAWAASPTPCSKRGHDGRKCSVEYLVPRARNVECRSSRPMP